MNMSICVCTYTYIYIYIYTYIYIYICIYGCARASRPTTWRPCRRRTGGSPCARPARGIISTECVYLCLCVYYKKKLIIKRTNRNKRNTTEYVFICCLMFVVVCFGSPCAGPARGRVFMFCYVFICCSRIMCIVMNNVG